MHSTQFTALAQAADEFGFTIHSMSFLPRGEGTYAGCTAILHDPDRDIERGQYAVGLGVLPDPEDRDGRIEAYWAYCTYDLTLERALDLFTTNTLRENRLGAWR